MTTQHNSGTEDLSGARLINEAIVKYRLTLDHNDPWTKSNAPFKLNYFPFCLILNQMILSQSVELRLRHQSWLSLTVRFQRTSYVILTIVFFLTYLLDLWGFHTMLPNSVHIPVPHPIVSTHSSALKSTDCSFKGLEFSSTGCLKAMVFK